MRTMFCILFQSLLFLFFSCNTNTEKSNSIDTLNKDSKNDMLLSSEVDNSGIKKLIFEIKPASENEYHEFYELTFFNDSVLISEKNNKNPESDMSFAEFKNGKLFQRECTDCFSLVDNSLCVKDPQTGESFCFPINEEKSTISISDLITNNKSKSKNTNVNEYFLVPGKYVSKCSDEDYANYQTEGGKGWEAQHFEIVTGMIMNKYGYYFNTSSLPDYQELKKSSTDANIYFLKSEPRKKIVIVTGEKEFKTENGCVWKWVSE